MDLEVEEITQIIRFYSTFILRKVDKLYLRNLDLFLARQLLGNLQSPI